MCARYLIYGGDGAVVGDGGVGGVGDIVGVVGVGGVEECVVVV